MPRADGPFKVLEKINENAYKLDLPAEFRVSPTFNVADLKPYLGDDDEMPSRTTSIQEGGDDEDISSIVTPAATPTSVIPPGPITRARARQINGQVLSLLCTYDLANENMILHSCSDLIVLRNQGIKQSIEGQPLNQMEQHSLHACTHCNIHPIHRACHGTGSKRHKTQAN